MMKQSPRINKTLAALAADAAVKLEVRYDVSSGVFTVVTRLGAKKGGRRLELFEHGDDVVARTNFAIKDHDGSPVAGRKNWYDHVASTDLCVAACTAIVEGEAAVEKAAKEPVDL